MSDSVVLALLVGAPVLALALAVAYHAQLYLLDRRGKLAPDEHSESAGASPEVVLDLRRSIEELHDQLGRQRQTLHSLMSASARKDASRAVGEPPSTATAPAPPPIEAEPPSENVHTAVRRLAAEGLSDRAIARRLRIGLEEVRLLSKRRPPPRPDHHPEPVA